MTLTPEGGAAIPVSVTTTRRVQGGSAIPVYGYMTAPTDGRPALGGAAIPVRVLTAADLKQNGGMWTLEGRPHAMPVYTAPAGAVVQGGPAIAVYPVNAWPTVPVVTPPAFVPTDIAGLQLWLKADGTLWQDSARTIPTVADGNPVGAWDDASGNARHAKQATAGFRPTLKLAIQNGKQVVRFDGSNDFLATPAIATPSSFTLFLVLSTTNIAVRKIACGCALAVSGLPRWGSIDMSQHAPNGSFDYAFSSSLSGNVLSQGQTQAAVFANNTFVLVETQYTAGNTTQSVWANAASKAITTSATAASSIYSENRDFTVGRFGDYDGLYWAGDFAEVLIYYSALSAANRAKVETYLNGRWAVY